MTNKIGELLVKGINYFKRVLKAIKVIKSIFLSTFVLGASYKMDLKRTVQNFTSMNYWLRV